MNKRNVIKWITLLIIFLFIGITITPVCMSKETDDEKDKEMTDEYDRWAVIIGISDYQGGDNDLHSPAHEAQLLYDSLKVRDARWMSANMKLLTDQQASKADILGALDWLIDNADDGDIVILSPSVHPDQGQEVLHRPGARSLQSPLVGPGRFGGDPLGLPLGTGGG